MTALPTSSELFELLPWLTPPERAEMDRLLTADTPSQLEADPALSMRLAGMAPDPWQQRVLAGDAEWALLLCSRQAGKSTVAAALALRTALLFSPALVLLLSPTLRQSGELFRHKLLPQWRALGCPSRGKAPTQLELALSNGSRVVSLPENEEGVRGFSSVSLIVIDEAARVDDALYRTVRPMLAVSGGRLVALSTPFGQRGWFFEEWQNGQGWERYPVRADECPRISPEFLADERQAMGPRWYRQEYELSFEAATDAVFDPAAVRRAVRPGEVLFGG
jgi:uncharacterized protein (DUF2267 family)